MELATERKLMRYDDLVVDCHAKSWKCELFTVEVGCCEFVGKSVSKFLGRLGICGKDARAKSRVISQCAENASAWIWQQYCLKQKTIAMPVS